MRRDADVGHAGRYGSPDVVQAPRLHPAVEPTVERALAYSPVREAIVCALAEEVIAIASLWH
jgi:hypothetical protein